MVRIILGITGYDRSVDFRQPRHRSSTTLGHPYPTRNSSVMVSNVQRLQPVHRSVITL